MKKVEGADVTTYLGDIEITPAGTMIAHPRRDVRLAGGGPRNLLPIEPGPPRRGAPGWGFPNRGFALEKRFAGRAVSPENRCL